VGLFKFIGKAIKGVAKAGLGVATGGVSDVAFDALEARNARKKTLAGGAKLNTAQQEALFNKLDDGYKPRLSKTSGPGILSPYYQRQGPDRIEDEYYEPPRRRRRRRAPARRARRRVYDEAYQ